MSTPTLPAGSSQDTDIPENEAPVDFSPLANLVNSLYNGNYRSFFVALAAVEDHFLTQDRYLHEHRAWFVREMRLRAYQQLLQSYRVVGLTSMANDFGVTVDYLDRYVYFSLFPLWRRLSSGFHVMSHYLTFARFFQGLGEIHLQQPDCLHD